MITAALAAFALIVTRPYCLIKTIADTRSWAAITKLQTLKSTPCLDLHVQVQNFPFPLPPDSQALQQAEAALVAIGALQSPDEASAPTNGDTGLMLTPIGRAMAALPLPPRHARMLLQARLSSLLPDAENSRKDDRMEGQTTSCQSNGLQIVLCFSCSLVLARVTHSALQPGGRGMSLNLPVVQSGRACL